MFFLIFLLKKMGENMKIVFHHFWPCLDIFWYFWLQRIQSHIQKINFASTRNSGNPFWGSNVKRSGKTSKTWKCKHSKKEAGIWKIRQNFKNPEDRQYTFKKRDIWKWGPTTKIMIIKIIITIMTIMIATMTINQHHHNHDHHHAHDHDHNHHHEWRSA